MLNRGFTLVEMIVAVAVFTAVMFVGTGAVLAVMDANQKTQALKTVINNLNFAVDDMARTIRVGSDYRCGGGQGDCPGGAASIALRAPARSGSGFESFAYGLSGGSITRTRGGERASITSPDITVERLEFRVTGTGAKDRKQPRVVIIIGGFVDSPGGERTDFDLQTLVSQREPDQ